MRLASWVRLKLGLSEAQREQFQLLTKWEFSQTDIRALLQSDPRRDEVESFLSILKKSPEEGFAGLLNLAESGSIYSMNYVGFCYGMGKGVAKDPDHALTWYRRAFDQGSTWGLLEFGSCLSSRGQVEAAKQVYDEGWRRGFVPAVYRRVRLDLRPELPTKERLRWKPALEWAVEHGHPAARYLLAKYLARGWFGVRGIPRGVRMVLSNVTAIVRGEEDWCIMA